MQITHEQAQLLIQRKLDQALNAQETTVLSDHLQGCVHCQTYASEMTEVDRLLFPMLKRQWNRQPVPLSMTALTVRNQKAGLSSLLAMRKAAIGMVALALFFSVWQFVISGSSLPGQMPLLAPPVPTPSTISTNTLATREKCEMGLYIVQTDDTLSEIAAQFSVSVAEIMELNLLRTETVQPAMRLVIPLCNFTPTGTVHPATFTTTYTPILYSTTSAPDG